MALRAVSLSGILAAVVTLLARRDAGEQDVFRPIAGLGLGMTLGASDQLMRLVIELRVGHPANGDRGFRNLGTLARHWICQRMAFFAGLLPQQAFGLLNALRNVCLIPHHKLMDCFGVQMRNGLGESAIEHQGMATSAMLGVGGRIIRHAMAIRAHQLHLTVGTF